MTTPGERSRRKSVRAYARALKAGAAALALLTSVVSGYAFEVAISGWTTGRAIGLTVSGIVLLAWCGAYYALINDAMELE